MICFFYLGLAGLVYIFLSFEVIKGRVKFLIPYGSGKNNEIAALVSTHGNFSSYIPICFMMLYFFELHTSFSWLVHLLGAALVVGRISHYISVKFFEKRKVFRFRQLGMLLTFLPLLILSIGLIKLSFTM